MKAARIVVLGIALAAGGVAALLAGGSDRRRRAPRRSRRSKPSTFWSPTATSALATTVSAQDMPWQTWPTAAAGREFHPQERQARRDRTVRRLDRARAVRRRRTDPRSQAHQSQRLGYMAAILPTGMRAVSTEISPETGAGGFILPNDHVDVILSRRDREAEKAAGVEVHTSETILTNVRVLAIDQTVEEKDGQSVVVGKTATLEFSAAPGGDARAVAPAWARVARLAQPRRSDGDKPDARTRIGRRGSINMVRFGVTTMTTPK